MGFDDRVSEEAGNASKQSIAGLYNRVASRYDRVGPRTFAVFGRLLVEDAQIRPGMRVLDIGTGRGAVLLPAGQSLRGQGLAAGIDLARQMVHQTRQEANSLAASPVVLACMDGERLAFATASFDMLLCAFAFFFLDARLALPEWRRVLRQGGRLAVSVAASGDPRWAWYEELLLDFHARHNLPFHSGQRSAGELNRPTEITAALSAHGFTGVQVNIHELDIRYPDVETWWQSKWTHGSRYPLEHIPPGLLPAFETAVLARAAQTDLTENWRLVCILAER